MIPPIDPSAAHHWNATRQQPRGGDRAPQPKRRPPRFENVLQDELTLWQVLLQPEPPPAIPEKSGFAAAYEAAERTASYRISFYQEHQPEQTEAERGNWWDTQA